MTFREMRYRLYEDDELDFDDEPVLETDNICNEDFGSAEQKDLSPSSIRSLVSNEVSRLMKDNPASSSPKAEQHDIAADKPQGAEGHSLYQQRLGQQHSSQQPHNTQLSPIDFHLPQKGHRHKRRPTLNHHLPKPHVNVIYRHLELINRYPNNHGAQIRFNHKIMGNYIIYSPIIGGDDPDTSMKNVLRFQRMCIQKRYKYLPLYTKDGYGDIIDICFIVYPRHQVEEQFTCLEVSVLEFMNQTKTSLSYLKCKDGVLILEKENKTIIYAFDKLNIILDDYSKARRIDLRDGSYHYLNPYPQSIEELEYRKNNMEIVLPRKKPTRGIRHKYYG